MGGEKKSHRSLREIFRGSSPLSASHLHPQVSNQHSDSSHSHRFFLRSRDSKGSTSSQSSTSSLKSANGNLSGGESAPVTPTITPAQATSDTESSNSFMSTFHHEGKERVKRKSRKSEARSESHLSLKRFFKILHPKDHSDIPKTKSSCHLPSSTSQLSEKYDVGRLIGTGASGSVNLVSDKFDPSKIYALKKFRSKLKNENEQDYLRKVRNEYLVGEHLRHQNLIHTIELFQEKSETSTSSEYFIVMEYCPFDFFNLVMSGLMKYDEICCYFRQIVNGVSHLHQSGIAHRDLKLDNCVVDSNGILKLIDFGSAFQFKKSVDDNNASQDDVLLDSTHKLLLAKGIVGSDPYLAPEVFSPLTEDGYDARLADVWSVAIIFCCMVLKRFPWKLPQASDPSYRAFAAVNSMNEPLSEQEMLESATKELNVSKEVIPKYGPERLLRILPPHSRNLIAHMLRIDTKERATIEEVASDQFLRSIEYCQFALESEKPPKFQIGDIQTEDDIDDDINDDGELDPAEPGGRRSITGETLVENEHEEKQISAMQQFLEANNHKHHLVSEKDLQKINAEKERVKRVKESGIA